MKNTSWTTIFLTFLLIFISTSPAHSRNQNKSKFSQEELEKIVAPIALYPDPLLAQILPASTYPLDIVQAARTIKSENDFDQIDKQDWDDSVKAIARYPDVLKKMNDDLEWTQQLGQAVIDQQDDVMQSIQSLRQQAKDAGNLNTTKEQIVKVENTQIEILPASPEVIYIPIYNPRVVFVRSIVPPAYPLISFSRRLHLGIWLNFGFYWPSRTIFYRPSYWYSHRHYHHFDAPGHHHHSHNTIVKNHTTNIYNNYSNTNVTNVAWKHDPKHGNPFNGRKYKNSHPTQNNQNVISNKKVNGHITSRSHSNPNGGIKNNSPAITAKDFKNKLQSTSPQQNSIKNTQNKNLLSSSSSVKQNSHRNNSQTKNNLFQRKETNQTNSPRPKTEGNSPSQQKIFQNRTPQNISTTKPNPTPQRIQIANKTSSQSPQHQINKTRHNQITKNSNQRNPQR